MAACLCIFWKVFERCHHKPTGSKIKLCVQPHKNEWMDAYDRWYMQITPWNIKWKHIPHEYVNNTVVEHAFSPQMISIINILLTSDSKALILHIWIEIGHNLHLCPHTRTHLLLLVKICTFSQVIYTIMKIDSFHGSVSAPNNVGVVFVLSLKMCVADADFTG